METDSSGELVKGLPSCFIELIPQMDGWSNGILRIFTNVSNLERTQNSRIFLTKYCLQNAIKKKELRNEKV